MIKKKKANQKLYTARPTRMGQIHSRYLAILWPGKPGA